MLERTGLIQRFKEETTAAHAGVDQMVSGYNPFSDKKNYGKFKRSFTVSLIKLIITSCLTRKFLVWKS